MKFKIAPILIVCLTLFYQVVDAKKPLNHFLCSKDQIKFDDGDSFSCGDEDIRILGIDTPEIIHKEHGIFIDQPYGREAKALTDKLLRDAKRVVIIRGGRGGYGRSLAHVLIDGELLAVNLIRAGLAHESISRYGDNGMPEFALEVTEAAKAAPKPKFEDPYVWRKKNQKGKK
ncbi:MAG: hypothetical protein HN337_07220 [Deltaproteobacteria bacterium]|jgi:endonuclease YncB( thermonuclease family)|nr:hypothetical protein [Deltaproteobacteria bacterium]